MGTRALINFSIEQDNEVLPLITIYTQYDGYLSGMGSTIAKFLEERIIVNGIPGSQRHNPKISNGSSELVAQFLASLKNEHPVGTIYLYPVGTRNMGEEFVYDIIFKTDERNGIDFVSKIAIEHYSERVEFVNNPILEMKDYIN